MASSKSGKDVKAAVTVYLDRYLSGTATIAEVEEAFQAMQAAVDYAPASGEVLLNADGTRADA